MSAFEARGTIRPHARTPYPKRRSSGGSDMGDSLGPGDGGLLAGCGRFFRTVFWIAVIVAVCVVIGLVL